MASSIQILRSTTAKERPFPGNLLEGQPAANVNSVEPGLFFKASDGTLVKIGPAAITSDGLPPNSGGVGQQGNTIGELWLDKSLNPPVLKVYDGTSWISAGSGGGGGTSLFVRWIYTAVGGETSLSGSSGGVALQYQAGTEEVFLNGVLLTRNVDYAATNGTSITNLQPLTAGDVATVISYIPSSTIAIPGQASLLRWAILASAGQTILSGTDPNGQLLAYTPGFEEVFVNGAFLRRGSDYTATNGTSITLTSALALDDEVTVLAFSEFQVGSVSSSDIQDGAIIASKLATSSVSSSSVQDGAIVEAKLAAGAVVDSKVSASAAIASSKLSFLQEGTGAQLRSVQSKLRDVVSVKDFGATGNGVTDDTAAIQAAINYASDYARAVYFPSHRTTPSGGGSFYKVTSTLTITKPISLIGESPNSVLLLAPSGFSGAYIIDYTLGNFGSSENVQIQNLILRTTEPTPASRPSGIYIENVSYLDMQNVEFFQTFHGVVFSGVRCFSNLCTNISGYANPGSTVKYLNFNGGGHWTFDHCTFAADVGFFIDSSSFPDTVNLISCNFEQCLTRSLLVEGGARGINLIGCRTEGYDGAGINPPADFEVDPQGTNEVYGFTCIGSTFTTDAGASTPIMLGRSGGKVRGIQISANAITYAAGYQIVYLGSNVTVGSITDNMHVLGFAKPVGYLGIVNAPRSGIVIFSNRADFLGSIEVLDEWWGLSPWGVAEGTYTPSWSGGTVAGNATPATSTGRWRRTGDVVELWIRGVSVLNSFTTAPTGEVRVSLPSGLGTATGFYANGSCSGKNVTFVKQLTPEVSSGDSYITLANITGDKTVASQSLQWSDVASPSGSFNIYISYQVS